MTVPRSRVPTTSAPTRTGVVALAMLVAVVLVGVAHPAGAHGDDPAVRYRLTGLEPATEGVIVRIVRGLTGQLVLANDTDQPVEVLDDAGRAFLRIGPEGVHADVTSPTWQASDRPFGLGDAATPAVSSSPRWVQLSDEARWGWYDHRLHADEVAVPPDAAGPVVLARWTVPLRVGGVDAAITGETVGGPVAGEVVPRLVTDARPVDGVHIILLPGAVPGLFMEVDDGHTVVVRGEAGEPFLRFDGAQVEANVASATWHRVDGDGTGEAVDAEAPADWEQVGSAGRYGWIEPRAAAPQLEGEPRDGQVLSTWTVPIEVDGRPSSIDGEMRWVRTAPVHDSGGLPLLNVALATTGLVTIATLLVVRRRSSKRVAARQ